MTKVLIAYATRFGSTREIATAIAHELNRIGLNADAAETTDGIKPTDYDALVIGSPMYGNNWLPAAGLYAAINSEQLSGRPVALFSVGTLGVKSRKAAISEHKTFIEQLKQVAPKLNVVSDEAFNGYFERANLPWYLRLVDRLAPTPEGDHRNWTAIQAWARSLGNELRH